MVKEKKNKALKLFSFLFFTWVITMVTIKSTPPGSTEQTLAAAFSALLGMILYGEWESFSNRNYWQAILLALFLFLAWGAYNKYWNVDRNE